MRRRQADLVSVAGEQEMKTFWERVIQPQVFFLLTMRYGSTEHVSNARRPEDVIANGQFLMARRDAYESVGGHAAVRNKAAEDLAMAQRFVQMGKRIAIVLGPKQLRTRMYNSLGELVQGWRKNVFAAGRDAVPGKARAVYPLALLLAPLVGIVPLVMLVLSLLGALGGPWLAWAAVCVAATLFWWTVLYGYTHQPRRYALAYPLGALALLYIVIGAIARGNRVAWKGRTYRAA
jgi:chlorobactene glucosyltransferase